MRLREQEASAARSRAASVESASGLDEWASGLRAPTTVRLASVASAADAAAPSASPRKWWSALTVPAFSAIATAFCADDESFATVWSACLRFASDVPLARASQSITRPPDATISPSPRRRRGRGG